MSPLFFFCACATVLASGLLPPSNVRLTSHNMDLYLRWDAPENISGPIVYSTKLHVVYDRSRFTPACVNTSALFCDLSDPHLGLKILEFGEYEASIQAQSGSEVSAWVSSQPLMMDRDTVIGPPAVALVSNGADLEVSVSGPDFRVSSIAHVFGPPHYNISYWPRVRAQQVSHELVQQSRVVLSDLQPWTEYCVQVHIQVAPGRNQAPAEASEPMCESTADTPSPPWLNKALIPGALALTGTLVIVAVVYRKQICHFLCVKDSLPLVCMLCSTNITQRPVLWSWSSKTLGFTLVQQYYEEADHNVNKLQMRQGSNSINELKMINDMELTSLTHFKVFCRYGSKFLIHSCHRFSDKCIYSDVFKNDRSYDH